MSEDNVEHALKAAADAALDRAEQHFERLGVSPTDEDLADAVLLDPAVRAIMDTREGTEIVQCSYVRKIIDSMPPPTARRNLWRLF
jgi:hypothetical protein